jgi:Type II secretory pathway, component PulD
MPAEESPAATALDGSPDMVLVDVVIIATQETSSTSKGINLLNALTLQLGSASAPGYSWSFDSSSVSRTVITKQVTIPALSYSLNIANAASSTNEVLARPTLAAIEGLPSEFFAGINVNAGVLSTTTLGSASVVPVDKRFGVSLAVTPNFLAEGMVKLKVHAQRTFVVPNGGGNGFAYRFDISETSTDANVVMKLGDTLVLSGLTEKENSKSREGVPGLQDVPLAQYVFSSQRNTDFQRSALILITPRAPIYAAKGEAATTAGEQALRERLGFASRIPSNVESIVGYLSGSELFRQFRQGDVAMERWDRTGTTAERLRQALSFLYY